jgi:serine/threonine protein phosphatase 1
MPSLFSCYNLPKKIQKVTAMHYVIGDVHGHYATLCALIKQLPEDATLLFVGDLIDRGMQSREVVAFVREGKYACVMGNHEELMFTYGRLVVEAYRNDSMLDLGNFWCSNGGIEALLSYGLLEKKGTTYQKVQKFEEALKVFEEDMAWMERLPTYLELPLQKNGLSVVVSHAPLGSVWELRNSEAMFGMFHKTATTSRRNPDANVRIFNVFGHTPQPFGIDEANNYANVDTGCYKKEEGYGMLSAYCIENGEVIGMPRAEK